MKNQFGLSTQEVSERKAMGLCNKTQHSITRSKMQILKENIGTLFNLLNILIAIALALVGAWSNILFIVIIIMNVLIGILQELHAKKLVDELSLFIIPSVCVLRDQKEVQIHVDELVMDDIMVLDSGKQICCDALILSGEVEVNEALLTGESDPIHKEKHDEVLSGSSIISGKCYAQIIHLGNDNYASKITNEVKNIKKVESELLTSMRKVTSITCLLIIPLGILLFIQAYYVRDNTLSSSIVSSSAGLLGMLPKGLLLLISVGLAAGVSKLAKQKILIQDLYSLETLAHVDTLCLDKTGTITNGKLIVEKILPLSSYSKEEILPYISSFLYHSDDNNATYDALCAYFHKQDFFTPEVKIPFSSVRKWSAATFPTFGTLIQGAPDKLLQELPDILHSHIQAGKRVLIIAKTKLPIDHTILPSTIEPLYAIILSDTLRPKVAETLAYFESEGIDIKIISGDHVDTVSAIAKEAGLQTYDKSIDMSSISNTLEAIEDVVQHYTIFGRVTPIQKKLIVQALQKHGHKVAMTGDGVNDMLALKEADCSIAIAEGSDAVKQMAQVVLLNSEFSYLPNVLLEGRRVVNNVTRVAGVFFIKTIYSVALSFICVCLNIPFPFIPIQITLIDLVVEAFPAFLTILEPNTKSLKGKFLPTVFEKALPHAIAIIAIVCTLELTQNSTNSENLATLMYFSVAIISMQAVIRSCLPMNRIRGCICITMVLGFLLAVFLFPSLLHISSLSTLLIWKSFLLSTIGVLLSCCFSILIQSYKNKKRVSI